MNTTTNFADVAISNSFNENFDTNRYEAVQNLLNKFGLNWTVGKENLLLPNGKPSRFYSLVRQDNGTEFAACSKDYSPYQNEELAELCYRIAGKIGLAIEKGGMFDGGGSVYIQLKTNELHGIGKNNDTVKSYVTAINSHNLTKQLRWGHSDITISCMNTFNAAYHDLKGNSARHVESMREKIEESLKEIEALMKKESRILKGFKHMAEVEVKKSDIIEVVRSITGTDLAMSKEELERNYTTYNLDRVGELLDAISSEMKQKGETKWGLFSGITKYTTHVMPVGKKEDARIGSKFIGKAYAIDNKAFSSLSLA